MRSRLAALNATGTSNQNSTTADHPIVSIDKLAVKPSNRTNKFDPNGALQLLSRSSRSKSYEGKHNSTRTPTNGTLSVNGKNIGPFA